MDRHEGDYFQCCWYNRIKGKHMYKYDSIDHLFIQLEYVIAMGNLSYNIKNETYKLEESDHIIYEDFIKNLNRMEFSKHSKFSYLFTTILYLIYKVLFFVLLLICLYQFHTHFIRVGFRCGEWFGWRMVGITQCEVINRQIFLYAFLKHGC